MRSAHSLLLITCLAILSACSTSTDLSALKVVHHTDPRVDSTKSGELFLVDRESGGLIVVTPKALGYYNHEFILEREVEFQHKYTGFGVLQGPDGLWFAGYEWWSWGFGMFHNMDFEIHAMPLGNSEPVHVWKCRNCDALYSLRLQQNRTDILFTRLLYERPRKLIAFNVVNGGQFEINEVSDIASNLPGTTLHSKKSKSGEHREPTHGSTTWWRHAYSICDTQIRTLTGTRNLRTSRCASTSIPGIGDVNVAFAEDHQTVVIGRDYRTLDYWDLGSLLDVAGFSDVVGWYSYPKYACGNDATPTRERSLAHEHGNNQEIECIPTIAVVSGSGFSCSFSEKCDTVTAIFELLPGGRARLIDQVPASTSATVRLANGNVIVAAGGNLLLIDPPGKPR